MTAPQPAEQEPGLSPAEEATLTALAVYFASTAAAGAVLLPPRLVQRLTALGLSAKAVRAAGRVTMVPPLTGRGRYGSPTRRTNTARTVKADEPLMRARYVLKAARRLTQALTHGVFPQALRLERGYLDGHRRAGRNRANAAAELDRVAADHGPWLAWKAVMDERTTADCAALNGRVFTIDDIPGGAPPGARHPWCRCRAVPAFPAQSGAIPTATA